MHGVWKETFNRLYAKLIYANNRLNAKLILKDIAVSTKGIFALSRLTQKADYIPQTLSLRAHRWQLLSHQKLISLVEAKKVVFGTVSHTKPLVISIFRRGIIARHAPPPTPKKGCG